MWWVAGGWLTLPPLIPCCTVAVEADEDEDVDCNVFVVVVVVVVDCVVSVVVDVVAEDDVSSSFFSARKGKVPSFLGLALITLHCRVMFRR